MVHFCLNNENTSYHYFLFFLLEIFSTGIKCKKNPPKKVEEQSHRIINS